MQPEQAFLEPAIEATIRRKAGKADSVEPIFSWDTRGFFRGRRCTGRKEHGIITA